MLDGMNGLLLPQEPLFFKGPVLEKPESRS